MSKIQVIGSLTSNTSELHILSQHLLKWWAFPLVDSLMIMILENQCTILYSMHIHKHIEIINGYQFIIRILSFHGLQLVYWFEQKYHRF